MFHIWSSEYILKDNRLATSCLMMTAASSPKDAGRAQRLLSNGLSPCSGTARLDLANRGSDEHSPTWA